MNKIQPHQPVLPAKMQKELDQQLAQISKIGQKVIFALDGVSTVHRFAVFEAISTSTTVSILKKAAEENGMTPELDAHLKQLEQSYFNVMGQIPKEASKKIIQTLIKVDDDNDVFGLIENVKRFFQQLLED